MSILSNPAYRPLLEIFRSSRNGFVYGGKIRFSHALVINLLYRLGPLKPRLRLVFRATKDHSLVLALFAIIFKIAVKILKQDAFIGSNTSVVKFIAGALAGWIVYSQHFNLFNAGITHQITLYCFSRVLVASGKILLEEYLNCRQPMLRVGSESLKYQDLTDLQSRRLKNKIYGRTWKHFAVLTWALVMLIYDYKPQYLQSSLRHSMAYIYDVEMDTWGSWLEFFGF